MGIEQLHESADIPQFLEGAPITNLMYAIWCSRKDLQTAFDLDLHTGQEAFFGWCQASLSSDYGVGAQLVDKGSDDKANVVFLLILRLLNHGPLYIESLLAKLSKVLPHRMRAFGKIFWNKLLARNLRKKTNKFLRLSKFPNSSIAQYARNKDFLLPGANLVGYVFSESGMGEHVRMSAASFSKTDIDFGVINFDYGVPSRSKAFLRNGKLESKNRYKANIFHINADQMINTYTKLGESFFSDHLNIIYPFWELSKFPLDWVPFLKVMDEVWAPTRFIKDSISNVLGNNVHYMPVGIELPIVKNKGRKYFGIPENKFIFLVTFDFYSYIHRKNPWGAVHAFMLAFPQQNEDVCLVIKVMNADESNLDWKRLKNVASQDRRIVLINKVMTDHDLLSLKLACDCYVSLHRAEGLGRGPMEAMLLSKPTILTNYSGCTDYAHEGNSCLVSYSLIPIQEGQYVQFLDQMWADPDIEHAAWHMKNLVSDPDLCVRLGKIARNFINESFSPSRCGNIYKKRLHEIGII